MIIYKQQSDISDYSKKLKMSKKITDQEAKEIGIESRLVERATNIRKVTIDDLQTQDVGDMSFQFACDANHSREEGIQIYRPRFDNSEYRCMECGGPAVLELE